MNDEVVWALAVAERICWDRNVSPAMPGLHGFDGSGHATVDSTRSAVIEIAAACRILATALGVGRD